MQTDEEDVRAEGIPPASAADIVAASRERIGLADSPASGSVDAAPRSAELTPLVLSEARAETTSTGLEHPTMARAVMIDGNMSPPPAKSDNQRKRSKSVRFAPEVVEAAPRSSALALSQRPPHEQNARPTRELGLMLL